MPQKNVGMPTIQVILELSPHFRYFLCNYRVGNRFRAGPAKLGGGGTPYVSRIKGKQRTYRRMDAIKGKQTT